MSILKISLSYELLYAKRIVFHIKGKVYNISTLVSFLMLDWSGGATKNIK